MHYDYKVIPAPTKGRKARGVKGPDGRFANSIETVLNDMAADGWEFQRAETLPSEERHGLTTSTTFRTLLVFRKASNADLAAFKPREMTPLAEEPAETDGPEDAMEDSTSEALPTPEIEADETEAPPQTDEHIGLSSVLRDRLAQLQNKD